MMECLDDDVSGYVLGRFGNSSVGSRSGDERVVSVLDAGGDRSWAGTFDRRHPHHHTFRQRWSW